MSHADVIEKNCDILLRCTTINCYVIDCLKAEDVLDTRQEAKLRSKRDSFKQCDLLFQWLKEASHHKYESFLQVMNDTEQEHVANLLTGSAEEDHLPLSEVRHRRLDKIRPKIANVIWIDSEVISELRSSKVISRTDAEDIRAEKVDYAKISKLIAAIMRRSNYSYRRFQDVLRKTLQKAAAQFLSEGEMPAVHLNNNRPDLDGPLSRAFNDILSNGETDDSEIKSLLAEMNELGLNPVKAIPGQSIVVFIYCSTVHNAAKFTQLYNSGLLQYFLESILNRLLLTIEPNGAVAIDSYLSLEDEDIATLADFTGIEGWKALSRPKLIGKKCGRDATTQTEDDLVKWKITEKYNIQQLEKDNDDDKRLWEAEKERLLKTQKDLETKLRLDETKLDQMENDFKNQKRKWEKKQDRLLKLQRELRIRLHLAQIQELENDLRLNLSAIAQPSEKRKSLERQLYQLEAESRSEYIESEYILDPILVQTIRTRASKKKKSIVGFTILGKELFAVNDESSEIEVYDSIKFSFRRLCVLKQLIYPLDIGSCNRNNCLYIFDFKGYGKSSEILRVDPRGNLTRNWSTGDDDGWGLSVTDELNVILTVYNKNKLNEYSPDGQLIREVNLSLTANISFPWHAIKLTNGHFLVSHGFYDDDDLHRVCEVDADGNLKRSFGGRRGSTMEQLNVPSYLSVDRNGCVMVADQENGRVLLLDSDLEFKREIVSKEKHGLRYATMILLDESNGRLFVADNGWDSETEIFRYGRILTFDVK